MLRPLRSIRGSNELLVQDALFAGVIVGRRVSLILKSNPCAICCKSSKSFLFLNIGRSAPDLMRIRSMVQAIRRFGRAANII